MKTNSLVTKFIFIFLTGMTAIFFLAYFIGRQIVLDETLEKTRQMVAYESEKINGQLNSFKKIAEKVGVSLIAVDDLDATLEIFETLEDSGVDLICMGLSDDRGLFTRGNERPTGWTATSRGWYQRAIASNNEIFFTDPYPDAVTGTMNISVVQHIGKIEGLDAVLCMDILMDSLLKIVSDIEIAGNGYAFLTDKDGLIITHPENRYLPTEDFSFSLRDDEAYVKAVSQFESGKQMAKIKDYDGVSRYIVPYHISTTDWILYVAIPDSVIYESFNSSMLIMALPCALVAIIAILLIRRALKRNIINPLVALTTSASKISHGDFNVSVGSNGKDEIAMLSNSFLELKTVIQSLINDINKVTDNFAEGNLDDLSVNISSYNGEFKHIAESVNRMVDDLVENCLYSIQFVSDIGNGNFNIDVRQFPGQRIIMTESFNAVKENLRRFNSDIVSIIDGASEGNLDVSMDSNMYKGDWSKMAEGINKLLTSVINPIREAIDVMNQLSKGNLQVSVKGSYKGEFEEMKSTLNNTLTMLSSYIKEISDVLGSMSNQDLTHHITREYVGDFIEMRTSINTIVQVFNRLLGEINTAAEQVASGANQISQASMTLAQGTTEQAGSVEELNATVEDIASQTQQNAENAKYASKLALHTKEAAVKGNKEMHEMLTAMEQINESSNNISKIIKVIEDIALQTNLLALNAAVEAARAGEHGKGFAVVAEEVRTLAGRSQNAAKNTAGLIEGSIEKVKEGSQIANNTAQAFDEIVSQIVEITSLVDGSAQASERQSEAIGQVNIGVSQISTVTQSNSATSQEQASAAQELSSQAELFRAMVNTFKL